MAGKVSHVVRLADELAVAIALRALGRPPTPQELPQDGSQDTMGMDTMFVALARLTSWIAVKNRIDDDEPERDFFSGARARLSRKAGGRGGRGGTPPPADGSGGGHADGIAPPATTVGDIASPPGAPASDLGLPAGANGSAAPA